MEEKVTRVIFWTDLSVMFILSRLKLKVVCLNILLINVLSKHIYKSLTRDFILVNIFIV